MLNEDFIVTLPTSATIAQLFRLDAKVALVTGDYGGIGEAVSHGFDLDQLPPFGFKLSVLPVKWVNTTAAPVRAVAIIED